MIDKTAFWKREPIVERHEVPELGDGSHVFVRELKPLEVEKLAKKNGEAAIAASVCTMGVCTADGKPFFDQPGDVMALLQGGQWAVMQRLCEHVFRLTGLDADSLDGAEKKSDLMPNSDSG